MAFETFDLGRVIQTAEAIKGLRRQSATDALRDKYLTTQIAGSEQSQQIQQQQFTDQQRRENTEWMVGASEQVLALPPEQQPQAAAIMFEEGKRRGIVSPETQMPAYDPQGLQQFVANARVQLGNAPLSAGKVGDFSVLQQGDKVLASAAPKQPDAVTQRWMTEVAQNGYKGSLLDYQKELKAAGANQVNINTKQETEESKAIGKALGQQYAAIQKAGVDANNKVSRYQRMTQLLDGVKTGKLTPKITELSALADSLGIKLDENIGEKQALQALSNEIALGLRNPSGGAGMPGALSDSDRQFLVSMTPGLANTPEGNKLIIQSAIKLAKRDQQVAKKAREYRAKHGTVEGFAEDLAQWSAENPLFEAESAVAEASAPQLTATGPNGEKLVLKNGQWVTLNAQ